MSIFILVTFHQSQKVFDKWRQKFWVAQYVPNSVVLSDVSDRYVTTFTCHFDNLVKMSVSSYITVKTEKSVSYNLPHKRQTKSQQEQHVISYRAQ